VNDVFDNKVKFTRRKTLSCHHKYRKNTLTKVEQKMYNACLHRSCSDSFPPTAARTHRSLVVNLADFADRQFEVNVERRDH
jgi:hypothetical protein